MKISFPRDHSEAQIENFPEVFSSSYMSSKTTDNISHKGLVKFVTMLECQCQNSDQAIVMFLIVFAKIIAELMVVTEGNCRFLVENIHGMDELPSILFVSLSLCLALCFSLSSFT
jgi:hypothetical protein